MRKLKQHRLPALIAAALAICLLVLTLGAGSATPTASHCYLPSGAIDKTVDETLNAINCPVGDTPGSFAVSLGSVVTAPSSTTLPTTTLPTTTIATTTTQPATTTTIPSTCVGVAMSAGQADIDAHGTGTAFCITGSHNWSLVPKSGDSFMGGTLDGNKQTSHGFSGSASNVTLTNIVLRNYNAGLDSGAIEASGSAWILRNLDVSGDAYTGASVGGPNWQIIGGRYHDNGQEGVEGEGHAANGLIINGVELDHNDFTNSTYSARKVSCGYEAGGVKNEGNDITITQSSVHDNACKGIWFDLGAQRATITNNHVFNNWDEGIFFEVSYSAVITNNVVTGNGLHNYNGGGFGWGGGITVSTSGFTKVGAGSIDIGHNTVSGNANGITVIDQSRNESSCPASPQSCESMNVSVHDNTITGSSTGAWQDDGDNLSTHNITFTGNVFSTGSRYCGLAC